MQAQQGPRRILRFGRYTLSRYPEGAWEFSDGMLGSTGGTPLGAIIGQRRWRREFYARPPGYWAREMDDA